MYPGVAVFENLPPAIRASVIWIGSHRGIERTVVQAQGIPYVAIPTGKLRRYLSVENVIDLFRVILGFFAARRVLKRHGVGIVFSKGGFVAVPVVWAAASLGVPIVIHESDSDPGLATRITARLAYRILVAYPETGRSFRRSLWTRVEVVGNPVRRAIWDSSVAKMPDELGLQDQDLPVVLIFGGSLGAHQLNIIVRETIRSLTSVAMVIHQTGEHDRDMIPRISADARPGRYLGRPYFADEFGAVLRRTDLAITRAGAGTLWELSATGTPAILIPLGTGSSRGDQIRNAERYAQAGAGIVIPSDEATPERVGSVVLKLLEDSDALHKMQTAAAGFGRRDSAGRIATIVEGFCREGRKRSWN